MEIALFCESGESGCRPDWPSCVGWHWVNHLPDPALVAFPKGKELGRNNLISMGMYSPILLWWFLNIENDYFPTGSWINPVLMTFKME